MDIIKPKQIAGKKVRQIEKKDDPALGEVRQWGKEVEEKKARLKNVKTWAMKCKDKEREEYKENQEKEFKRQEASNRMSDRIVVGLFFAVIAGIILLGMFSSR